MPTSKVLAVVLNRLAFGEAIQGTRSYLGLGLATTSKYTHLVYKILVQHFFDKYIKIPNGQ